MADLPLTPPQRRALTWGLITIALAAAVVGGIAVVRSAGSGIREWTKPSAPVVTHDIVVERLREVAKLVASEMTLRDVVIYEQTRYGSSKRALLVVTGRVAAGIDLDRGANVEVDSIAKRIRITLPPAQILSVDVLNVTTYDERAGLLNPFRPEDRDAIQRRTRAQLMVAARQSGILEHADQSAARALQQLLGRDGFTVEIRHPVVQAAPGG